MERIAEPEWMDLPEEAEAYARADFREVNEAFVQRLLELETRGQALRVLDFGTGPGDIPLRIAELRPQWRIAGMDASRAMLDLAHARRAIARSLWWVQADAKSCPFPARSFDLLISNSILHHVADPAALWTAVRELARPGARVFFRDLVRPESTDEAARLVQLHAGAESVLLQEEFFRSFLSAYTPDEVRAQLARTGLRSLKVVPVTVRHMDMLGTVDQD